MMRIPGFQIGSIQRSHGFDLREWSQALGLGVPSLLFGDCFCSSAFLVTYQRACMRCALTNRVAAERIGTDA